MKPGYQPSIVIGMQPGTKSYRLERNMPRCALCHPLTNITMRSCFFDEEARDESCAYECGSWCLWISPSQDFTHGTYLKLYDNGKVERVTLHPSGYEDVGLIKPEDKEVT